MFASSGFKRLRVRSPSGSPGAQTWYHLVHTAAHDQPLPVDFRSPWRRKGPEQLHSNSPIVQLLLHITSLPVTFETSNWIVYIYYGDYRAKSRPRSGPVWRDRPSRLCIIRAHCAATEAYVAEYVSIITSIVIVCAGFRPVLPSIFSSAKRAFQATVHCDDTKRLGAPSWLGGGQSISGYRECKV